MAKQNKTPPATEIETDVSVETEVVAAEAKQDEVPAPVAEETSEKESGANKTEFWGNVKGFFVKAGKTIASPFKKLKAKLTEGKKAKEQPAEVSEEQVTAEVAATEQKEAVVSASPAENTSGVTEAVAVKPSLMEAKLPFKEKFSRFAKSQSGWLFVMPAVVLMLIFTAYPIVSAFVNAFKQNYLALNGFYNGWGFDNFVRVLKGDTGTGGASFTQCLVNTLVFTLISVPVSTLLALLISVALNSIKPLQKAYQTIFFLPYLTNALAMGAVFATFFSVIGTASSVQTYGLFNNVLMGMGLKPVDWIGVESPKWFISDNLSIPWAKYIVVIIYEIWSGLPFKILILFSALQSVNKQYYDAAKIDGASKNTVLWKITAPMISPMISYLLVTGIMGGMKQYTAIVGLFGVEMGQNYDVGTMVGYIYKFVENGNTGYAFAASLLLFFIIMALTAVNRAVSKKKVSY